MRKAPTAKNVGFIEGELLEVLKILDHNFPRLASRGLIETIEMLKPDDKKPKKYPKMNAEQREAYAQAVAEEHAARDENVRAARPVADKLRKERQGIAELVGKLKNARIAAGVSLAAMEERTGIRKSALSRLENAKTPNPTLATLQRYAAAIGCRLDWIVEADD